MNENISQIPKPNILVVDDTPANLRLLNEILTGQGYIVRPVPDGRLAIASAKAAAPDLVLLDIRMPEMSGYEVCQELKTNELTREIPIIFISALHDVVDKVKAFELGGVDYITKPFQPEEVLSRVKTHLTLRTLQKRLQEKNEQLSEEIAERTHAEEALKASELQLRKNNASKDKFFSIIAHDLRGPISSLNDLTHFASENIDTYTLQQLKEIILLQRDTTENLAKLLENLLTWSRLQRDMIEFIPQEIDLKQLVKRSIALFTVQAEHKQISLKNSVQESVIIYADFNMIDTVIRNLVSNAIKFTHPNGSIEITVRQDQQYAEVSVTDNGIGIEPQHLAKLFDPEAKYKRLGTAHEKGTGLGLILCKEFVEHNGGRIWAESEVSKGSTFTFTLPKMGKQRNSEHG
ncbi:response regulator receiver sensor signal transduction histidine kinase [Candidatus Vecturithrix granuli]|uniref:histidine kinase n=1 Tax=Vecturithrix granuli TaxID=1499967 RepID=A0A0S6W9I2_VECG1|nr:response regulator receiver sensor signal transduction histidine kinase [Candidatus Vecturithrix granuli]